MLINLNLKLTRIIQSLYNRNYSAILATLKGSENGRVVTIGRYIVDFMVTHNTLRAGGVPVLR